MSFRVEDLFRPSKTPTRPNELVPSGLLSAPQASFVEPLPNNGRKLLQFPLTPDANMISCAQLEQSVKGILDSPCNPFPDTPSTSGLRKSQRRTPLRQKSVGDQMQSAQTPVPSTSQARINSPAVYQIPQNVVDNLCLRFLNNIPEHEKRDPIRICFQLEQAHWYYVDYCCEKKMEGKCIEVGFRDFVRQVFRKSDMLSEFKHQVDEFIEAFRQYKSGVPTYGAVMFNQELTDVVLVQGYFSSKNSWGFPKGKVNEGEDPVACAIREVLEETGYDITDKIRPDICFRYNLNETAVCLYAAVDVDENFSFHPHMRKEIRKIAWYPINDLPRHKFDFQTCAHRGYTPRNFYTISPAVNEIRRFAAAEKKARSQKSNKTSAFQPVIPKPKPTPTSGAIQQTFLESLLMSESPTTTSQSQLITSASSQFPQFPHSSAANNNNKSPEQPDVRSPLFTPLRLETEPNPPSSVASPGQQSGGPMSGEYFLRMLLTPNSQNRNASGQNSSASAQQHQEIKHPKAIHSSSIIPSGQLTFASPEPTAFNPIASTLQRKTPGHNRKAKKAGSSRADRSDSTPDPASAAPDAAGFQTPPLLLPTDLLASSPANSEAAALASAQAYLEACGKALRDSVRRKPKRNAAAASPDKGAVEKKKRNRRKRAKPKNKSGDAAADDFAQLPCLLQTTPKRRQIRLMDNENSSVDETVAEDSKDELEEDDFNMPTTSALHPKRDTSPDADDSDELGDELINCKIDGKVEDGLPEKPSTPRTVYEEDADDEIFSPTGSTSSKSHHSGLAAEAPQPQPAVVRPPPTLPPNFVESFDALHIFFNEARRSRGQVNGNGANHSAQPSRCKPIELCEAWKSFKLNINLDQLLNPSVLNNNGLH